jgi:HD superfamily phosphohydrolase
MSEMDHDKMKSTDHSTQCVTSGPPPTFFENLRSLYEKSAPLRSAWKDEEIPLRKIIGQVASELPNIYRIDRPLGVGGSGVVAIVEDTNLHTKRALKVSRPSPGKEHLLARVLQSETENLLRLSHQNLIRIFAQGAIQYENQLYPFYVMDFVEGVSDSDQYLMGESRTQEEVLGIFEGVIAAVEYLHSQGTIHMDLKPGNILVTPAGIPILSDLGFAKQFRDRSGFTLIGGTEGFIHPDARKLVNDAVSDPNRMSGQALRTLLKPEWDLYSLGKTFLILLKALEDRNSKLLSPYARRYLRLLACRLLDGYNAPDERAAGISVSTLKEIKYKTVSEAKTDLEKLRGSYNLENRIPELNLHVQDSIQVSTLTTTPFTRRVSNLLSHPAVMRLGSFTQLGMLNLVYPTATHTRLEHSLGTFSVLCRFILALYNDPLNPLFRQIMNEEDLRAGLLSALLHDVGQYPLAHDIEEADSFLAHEKIGESVLKQQGSHSLTELLSQKDGWDVTASRVHAILSADPTTLRGSLKDRILHSLINGPIDADKVDYLMRDSRHLGLIYGSSIDLDRLLRCLTVVFREQDTQTYAAMGIHEKGKVPAEAIAFVRYVMFGQVYWHHAYRSIKTMLHRMVWEMLWTKDEDERTKLRNEFRSFVSPSTPKIESPNLFGEIDDNNEFIISDVTQIQQSDLSVLRWIAKRSGDVGKEFLSLLKTRRVYKRILVLTHEKSQDKRLWEEMSDFYHKNRTNGKPKFRLQQEFNKRIIALVEGAHGNRPHTSIITPDARNRFLVYARKIPVVLVDFPPSRKGSTTGLEYVVEEDRRWFKIDELKTGNLEQSVVWKVLQQSFQESIGKLRVFCHPDHAEFLSAYLSRLEIEEALTSSLHEVAAE